MKTMKPKEMAKKLGMSPSRVSHLANAIENHRAYLFHKTALGSYLFQEKDAIVLTEYDHIQKFFMKRQIIGTMIRYRLQQLFPEVEQPPSWISKMKNIKKY